MYNQYSLYAEPTQIVNYIYTNEAYVTVACTGERNNAATVFSSIYYL